MTLYAGETLERFQPHFELLFGSNGDLIGIQNPRANGADLRFSSDGTETIGTLNVTSSFNIYNTTPISSTDYERLRLDASSNVFRVWTQNNGTGSTRALQVGTASTDGATAPVVYTQWSRVANPFITHVMASTTTAGVFHELASTSGIAASGSQTAVGISPTFAQTSTAAGIALLVNPSGTFGSGGGKLQSWQLASSELGQFTSTGVFYANVVASASYIGIVTALGGSPTVRLERDADDTLALRRTTNAQTFRVYNTYTDGSNYERGALEWVGNNFIVGTQNAGTGSARNLVLNGAAAVLFQTATTSRWQVNGSGHFLAVADNTYDIGASGATRPRAVYVAGSITTGTAATLHTTSTALTDYAGASSTGPFTNSPVAGNPTKWIAINDNGTTRYIPTWS